MRITLLLIGKTKEKIIQKLTDKYTDRLKHYAKFDIQIIPELRIRKNLSEEEQKTKEGEEILKRIQPSDELVLLDEKGTDYTSMEFADWLQKQMNSGKRQVVFVVGGPFGFSEEIYRRSDQKIALSKMTFSHEMIRPFFVEQVYRGFTILRNEAYHHE